MNDELDSVEPERLFSSPVVLILFVIDTKADGHWISAQPQLPATVNGELVSSAMLLTSGILPACRLIVTIFTIHLTPVSMSHNIISGVPCHL